MDLIKERIDRFLASEGWCREWPHATVKHLNSMGSDHRMILLMPEFAKPKFPKRFVYDRRWSGYQDCVQLIGDTWSRRVEGGPTYRLMEKIRSTRMTILTWRKKSQINSAVEIKRLESLIEEEQDVISPNFSLIRQYETLLKKAVGDEEAYWKAKSRIQWLKEGG